MSNKKLTHPGKELKRILQNLNLTITQAAKCLDVNRTTLSLLINGKQSLSPEMAIRIGMATNTIPKYWLNMQFELDLWQAMKKPPKNVKRF